MFTEVCFTAIVAIENDATTRREPFQGAILPRVPSLLVRITLSQMLTVCVSHTPVPHRGLLKGLKAHHGEELKAWACSKSHACFIREPSL